MADDVTDSDTSIAALKTDQTGDNPLDSDPRENHEETKPMNQGKEAGSGDGSSEINENGNGEQRGSSDVPDDGASSSRGADSSAVDTGTVTSVASPGGNGTGESAAVASPDNHADNMNVDSNPTDGDVGFGDSDSMPPEDITSDAPALVDVRSPDIGSEEVDRLLGTPVQDEMLGTPVQDEMLGTPVQDENPDVPSLVPEESAEQDQSVPECSSGVVEESMETDEVADAGDAGSEAVDPHVESTSSVSKDEDSVVPVRDEEPSGSETAQREADVKDSVSGDAEVKAETMEVAEDGGNDAASEAAVVPMEKDDTVATTKDAETSSDGDKYIEDAIVKSKVDNDGDKIIEDALEKSKVDNDGDKIIEDAIEKSKVDNDGDKIIEIALEKSKVDNDVPEASFDGDKYIEDALEKSKVDNDVSEASSDGDKIEGEDDTVKSKVDDAEATSDGDKIKGVDDAVKSEVDDESESHSDNMDVKSEDKDDTTKDTDVQTTEGESKKGPVGTEENKDESEAMETDETKTKSPSESTPSSPKKTEEPEKKEEEQNVLKDYAGDVMDDFLGMFGLDKLDEDEKEKLSVSDKFTAEKTAALAKTAESVPSPKTSKPSTPSAPTPPPAAQTSTSSKSPGGKSQGKPVQKCIVCKKVDKCKYNIVRNGDVKHLCDDNCFKTFRANPASYLKAKEESPAPASQSAAAESSSGPVMSTVEKECVVCKQTSANKTKQFLSWQGMNYCSETCLGKFQTKLSKTCAYCEQDVTEAAKARFCMSLGKDVNQFCQAVCLEDFKKHMKLCAYCQMDLSKNPDSFAAPVGKGTGFKDFCTQACLQKYEDKLFNKDKEEKEEDSKDDGIPGVRPRTRSASGLATCAVCGKMSTTKHEVTFEAKPHKLCSDPCFAAFRYTNKLLMNKCDLCGANVAEGLHVQYEGQQKKFCTLLCVNTFKVAKKKMVSCTWCATKKSNFDMIERVDQNNKFQLFCTLNCLSLYRVNIQATSNQKVTCDQCRKHVPAQYHLTMSDASVRNFCSYTCVVAFQAQFNQSRKPASAPPARGKVQQQAQQTVSRTIAPATQQKLLAAQKTKSIGGVPVISNVMSLAPPGQKPGVQKQGVNSTQRTVTMTNQVNRAASGTQTVVQKVVIQPPAAKGVKNKALLCKPFTQTKATTCRPHTQTKETQTDESMSGRPMIIPIPVPIYVPCPAGMYTFPTPVPLPIPVPIPVPVFLPTTKKTTESIFKYMQEIQEKMPADPFEAELLMMAAAVASGPDSDEEDNKKDTYKPPKVETPVKQEKTTKEASQYQSTPQAQEQVPSSNLMGEDMLQMALRLATEMTEPVDLESSLDTAASKNDNGGIRDDQENEPMVQESRGRGGKGRKRSAGGKTSRSRNKRQKVDDEPDPPPQPVPPEPQVQPDAGYVLKYTYGVNAWKHWVLQKNQQLEKALKQNHRIKLFKTDILQCTSDELNYTLCLFVKEVRKPNGEEYAPDSIYYLCLGIQMYLFENARVDNIFTDIYYEKFTECLNEVSMRYEPRYAPSGHLICRIEEEHLWECKQLGAHSPHVLLNTLIYFNTRDFSLKNPLEHLRLSFSHIMKHWKKSGSNSLCPSPTNLGPNGNTKNSGRTVYLRYYAPAPNAKGNKKKKDKDEGPVFEQAENIDNPLRCPVKLYEFYLSKCPESIRNRNDVFYLVPERSCVPDSPVWYSAASLGTDSMAKMLNRLRMVKEIQESCHGAFNVGFTG